MSTNRNKKGGWKWWQSPSKSTEVEDLDYVSSIAPSSLIVQHSIHSKESDILSTTSIKSKPWISQKAKTSISPTQEESIKSEKNRLTTPASSLLMNVPSKSSSTVPVINYDINKQGRKNNDAALFSGIRVCTHVGKV
ncbi:hypothetical protein INT48_009452 [Thamnidium elegans]|uniref:Uncharacterized protein n=1 Tax=Thamnidium elegans TaxID=101142 RepID=A0A8H7VYT8_9FUNG|nr:hypothetical protein INT48_009452 [Thamnidium elegans]